MRRPIIAGNWKMNPPSLKDASALATRVSAGVPESVDVVLIPPACFLGPVLKSTDAGPIMVGAQNIHAAANGAYTGELAASMVRSIGCRFVLCGHSERRTLFKESSVDVGHKVSAALRAGLSPVLCVGETRVQREAEQTEEVLASQLTDGLAAVDSLEALSHCVIAYEPVWAIGTGLTATPSQAETTHVFIRKWLSNKYGHQAAEALRIQYGGSVKPANAAELLAQPNIDGALVGGASLKAESFLAIIACASGS